MKPADIVGVQAPGSQVCGHQHGTVALEEAVEDALTLLGNYMTKIWNEIIFFSMKQINDS